MRRNPWSSLLLALGLALTAPMAPAAPSEHEQAVAGLRAELGSLDGDPSLASLGRVERLKARQALDAAAGAKRSDREHALALARTRIQIARLAAEAELYEQQAAQLDRERDQILLEASRREAERVRMENERLRLAALAREEALQRELERTEAEREAAVKAAAAEAEQARKLAAARAREAELARKEAELAAAVMEAAPPPSRREGGRTVYTLAGNAFASGSATLTAAAQASLYALAAQLPGSGAITVEGHTDSQGGEAANLALSRRRAEAVRRLLEQAGIASGRITAVGKGQAEPVADNGTAEGRARNRRVEIIVE
ncbi:OmpA family protein [Arenimonas fontis]|uniref:OmpA family protein n=1 Tax=Arenimonas fontis TaxID=2608255 RepID=A0A5B2ZE87_9GAMM|nr:OmpA family protein [Arenimonas fontis]KAA2285382.1 OmpA family protein [Arenimonas fontis]